jgi:hypothetical protein
MSWVTTKRLKRDKVRPCSGDDDDDDDDDVEDGGVGVSVAFARAGKMSRREGKAASATGTPLTSAWLSTKAPNAVATCAMLGGLGKELERGR